jgi:H+/Cl- antiporter ClcA
VLGGPAPAWWPLPWLVLCGLLVGLTIRYLPGSGGHSPALGFQTGGGPATGRELPGIILAALATLGLGAVRGPEAPLIAIGGGFGALAVRLVRRDAPPMALPQVGCGMNLAAGIGMGRGSMCTAMLRLPLTSTLLAVVLMGVDGVIVTPQVVVAVVVAFVITIVLPAAGPKTPEPA